ncbi:DivIVA domain-containing protein [Sinomonas sp. ASV322]|uniref:DivIVA domain-containing protein n=1 Tax=Sinomonas sp. ASV322 TaxID=3041920 RepID=UPI0027DB5B34|nr:DivIVA domain-containing protein [Sinomonas sp. ASV322]MDQ4503354.1 DivIVA domain-containing protein [Sinomonas sp. ASV322]
MSFFLVFLAILLLAGVVWFGVAAYRGRQVPDAIAKGFEEPSPGLPPILLPDQPSAADVDRVRFSLGLRGYRMDQVDEVLERLRDRIAAQDAEIASLRKGVDARTEPDA